MQRYTFAVVAVAMLLPQPSNAGEVVSVPATHSTGTQRWLDTGINVTKGAPLSITARGRWRLGSGPRLCDADGLSNFAPYNGHRYGTLMGKIGSRGKPFAIGKTYAGTSIATGRLYLANNDSNSGDNSGVLKVSINTRSCRDHRIQISVAATHSTGSGRWLDTGVNLARGQTLSIVARGSWRLGSGPRLCDANGLPNFAPYNGHRYGTLMGKIGSRGKPFAIGKTYARPVRAGGRLYLANNDSNSGDNSGALKVSISLSGCQSGRRVQVAVPATHSTGSGRWLDTGVNLARGQALSIVARGSWRLGSGPRLCDANGLPNFAPYNGHRYGTLMGKIGGRGKAFPIGKTYTGAAPAGGRLYLANNDSNSGDNSGSLQVSITAR